MIRDKRFENNFFIIVNAHYNHSDFENRNFFYHFSCFSRPRRHLARLEPVVSRLFQATPTTAGTMAASPVTILYGSETGNAQDYAHYLARKLRYCSLNPTVSSLDEYPLKSLVTDTKYLIVVCSTTGQGELPRNGKRFFKFLLRKKLPPDLLSHVQITSFGLGDSSYPKFNYAIKKIHTRLLQLGCAELCPRCESDEISPEGADGYFAEWSSVVIDALQKRFPDSPVIDDFVLLPPELNLTVDRDAADLSVPFDCSLTRSKNVIEGHIVSNTRVTSADHFQDVRHVTIGSEAGLSYLPGDTAALYPSNDDKSVQMLLDLQPHWLPIADKPLTIHSELDIEGGLIKKECLTLRTLIKYHLDIMSIPRRTFFSLAFHFVDDTTEDGQREKEKFYEFTKLEESEDLYNYANRPRRLIMETISEFENNLRIPVEYVLDLFPLIKVRLFLIASKPSESQLELAVAVVEYKTMLRRIRKGLCTKWLKQLQQGDRLIFSIHPSNLKFGASTAPIIMIGPGTGIAPMKSLIEYAAGQRELYLFTGCRDSEKDFYFKELWELYEKTGQLKHFPAISRQAGFPYKYVQDRLFAERDLVSDLIVNQNAVVYLCGSSGKMPTQVRVTLVEIIKSQMSNPEAYLLKLENEGRYIQETW